MSAGKGAADTGGPRPLTPEEIVARCAELLAEEKARRREAAKPKPKPKWVSVGYEAVVLPPLPQPKARGRYVERTTIEADLARQVSSQEAYERGLYERGASIDAPDDEPTPAPVAPKAPVIRVPRRTRVITGAGDPPPKPTRWGQSRRNP